MKVLTVIGARPQFIKAAPVSRALAKAGIDEFLVHTGQHFDADMSQIFFDDLGLPKPDVMLSAGGLSRALMIARILEDLDSILTAQAPDLVLVYGDTNSTLAGALAANARSIPLAHVEAGLRSFNKAMPEEHNRILTDRLADLLFCPSRQAVEHLAAEGITQGVLQTGDVMLDAVRLFSEAAAKMNISSFGVTDAGFALATLHRQENTDDQQRLTNILDGLAEVSEAMPVLLPLHPRTRKMATHWGLSQSLGRLRLIEPVGYIAMQRLIQGARVVLTDSGGLQKEAFFHETPCVTLRDETEWPETVHLGWNHVVGADKGRIVAAVQAAAPGAGSASPYGDGDAAGKIVEAIAQFRAPSPNLLSD